MKLEEIEFQRKIELSIRPDRNPLILEYAIKKYEQEHDIIIPRGIGLSSIADNIEYDEVEEIINIMAEFFKEDKEFDKEVMYNYFDAIYTKISYFLAPKDWENMKLSLIKKKYKK